MTVSSEGTIKTRFVSEGAEELARDARDAGAALEGVGTEAREASAGLEAFESGARDAADSSSALADAARESTAQAALMQQRLSALAGGLSGLGSILGTESELGSVVGRMGQFASVGIQLGQVIGPGGAVVGGILGAAIPALDSMVSSLLGVVDAEQAAEDRSDRLAAAIQRQADAASVATRALATLQAQQRAQQAESDAAAQLARIRSGAYAGAEDAQLAAQAARNDAAAEESLRRRIALVERVGGSTAELRRELDLLTSRTALLGSTEERVAEAEAAAARLSGSGGGAGGRRGGGGGGRRAAADDGAAREADRQAEIAYRDTLALLDAERYDAEQAAAQARMDAMRDQEKAAQEMWEAATRREEESARMRESMQRAEAERVERAARLRLRQTQAWQDLSSEMLGTTLEGANAIGGAFAGAFEQAITGQESFDVAFAKGAKSALIQFGTAQVAEGIGALLTAAGNVILNPPAAATKAVEGAGKIALGVSLGAAGAAISVPSGGAAEASADRAPRLGPSEQTSESGRAVVVNLNAPSIVSGTRAQLGREMSRAISDGTRRFGRGAA